MSISDLEWNLVDVKPLGNGLLAKGSITFLYNEQTITRNWYAVAEKNPDGTRNWSVFREASADNDKVGDNLHFTRNQIMNYQLKKFIELKIVDFLNQFDSCSLQAA